MQPQLDAPGPATIDGMTAPPTGESAAMPLQLDGLRPSYSGRLTTFIAGAATRIFQVSLAHLRVNGRLHHAQGGGTAAPS